MLADRLLHFDYAESREKYARLLCKGDYIISTALHEFFGISVLEGVRAGCRPVVPDRLSYREFFPKKYRYGEGQLKGHLRKLLSTPSYFPADEAKRLTDPYSWPRLGRKYQEWLQCGGMPSP